MGMVEDGRVRRVRGTRLRVGDGGQPMSDRIDSGVVDWIWDSSHPGLARFNYTDNDRKTLASLLLRPCPHCGAKPGQWCHTTPAGREIVGLDEQHVARRQLR